MFRFRYEAVAAVAAATLLPVVAHAQIACTDLPSQPPLAGNPAVATVTATVQTTNGRQYCQINLTWRDPAMVGAAAGYAPGTPPQVDTFQNIRMGFALPLNTNTGDAAWGGRLVMTAGGGAQGSVPGLTGMIGLNPPAIGGGTDSGHGDANSGSGDNWGVIQGVGLNQGKIKDWAGGRSNGIAVKLVKQIAATYYGNGPSKTYWDGCSGGGHMGWAQVQFYPEEYDGALIGASANHWQKFRLADSWDELVRKKLQLQTGETFSAAQVTAFNAAAHAQCGAPDGAQNALDADPRACTFSARANVCGAPGAPAAPACLSETQAAAVDKQWDGPRNSKQMRIWHPYERGVNVGTATTTQGSTAQVLRYAMYDTTFDANNLYLDRESIDLAAAKGTDVSKAITYEDAAVLVSQRTADAIDDDDPADLAKAHAKGMKIITYHGTQDPLIHFRNSVDMYRRVATQFGGGNADFQAAQSWYRLFLAPAQGHCGNPFPNAFDALVSWVEKGIAPDSLTRTSGQVPKGCPFPEKAVYLGGATTDPNSYTCSGNLDSNPVALCSMLMTKEKLEKSLQLATDETDIRRICSGYDRRQSPGQ